MRKVLTYGLITFCVFLFSNCATIIHGSKQDVSVSSSPTKATVVVDGIQRGTTPVTFNLSRKDHHTVQINLAGYLPYETKFTRKVDGWIVGNVLFGGLIGLAVDAITGGMYKLSPGDIQADLKTGGSTALLNEEGLYLTVVLQPDPSWEKIGQLKLSN